MGSDKIRHTWAWSVHVLVGLALPLLGLTIGVEKGYPKAPAYAPGGSGASDYGADYADGDDTSSYDSERGRGRRGGGVDTNTEIECKVTGIEAASFLACILTLLLLAWLADRFSQPGEEVLNELEQFESEKKLLFDEGRVPDGMDPDSVDVDEVKNAAMLLSVHDKIRHAGNVGDLRFSSKIMTRARRQHKKNQKRSLQPIKESSNASTKSSGSGRPSRSLSIDAFVTAKIVGSSIFSSYQTVVDEEVVNHPFSTKMLAKKKWKDMKQRLSVNSVFNDANETAFSSNSRTSTGAKGNQVAPSLA